MLRFALALSTLLLSGSALAALPMCSANVTGKCQVSSTSADTLYSCGNGNYVPSTCQTCADACNNCTHHGTGCAQLANDNTGSTPIDQIRVDAQRTPSRVTPDAVDGAAAPKPATKPAPKPAPTPAPTPAPR